MKNLYRNILSHIALAALSAVLVCCGLEPQENGYTEVSFAAHIPDDSQVKAFGGELTVDKLTVGVFSFKDGEYTESYRETFNVVAGSTTTDITLALAKGQTYSFIFWAYNSECPVYDITDLQSIRMQPDRIPDELTYTFMEKMDAFCSKLENLDTGTGLSARIPVKMERPLVQVNAGTTGNPQPATFTAKNTGSTYSPFTGSVSGNETYCWKFTQPTTEKFTVEGNDYTYLAMGYLFAEEKETQIECTLAVQQGETVSFPSVTIQANYKTNIAGNFTENISN